MSLIRYQIILILSLILLVVSCKVQKTFNNWEGVGEGDSYLVIQDSTLIFNGPDHSVTELKIESISKDSIYCRDYDSDTGELRTLRQFSHSRSLQEISTNFDSTTLHFTNIKSPKLFSKNQIDSISYEIYDYNENLLRKYLLRKNGTIEVLDENSKEIKCSKNENRVEGIFRKLSILDLDKFVWSEKNFWMISHAPCHCLEIDYNQKTKLRYCRQKHNSYINGILNDIKTKTK